MADGERAALHPLEQISSWLADHDEATIGVAELYEQGPDRLGITETELREWIAEGVGMQVFRITGLTGTLTLDETVELPRPLPQSPTVGYGRI
jgi:hypothetical protein